MSSLPGRGEGTARQTKWVSPFPYLWEDVLRQKKPPGQRKRGRWAASLNPGGVPKANRNICLKLQSSNLVERFGSTADEISVSVGCTISLFCCVLYIIADQVPKWIETAQKAITQILETSYGVKLSQLRKFSPLARLSEIPPVFKICRIFRLYQVVFDGAIGILFFRPAAVSELNGRRFRVKRPVLFCHATVDHIQVSPFE